MTRVCLHTASRLSSEANPYAVFRATCSVTSPRWTECGDDPDSWHAPHDAAGGLLLWTIEGDPLRAEPPSRYLSLDALCRKDYNRLLDAGAVRGMVVASYASSGGRMVALCHSGGEWWITVSRESPRPHVGSTEAALHGADPGAETLLMAATPVEPARPCLDDCGEDDHWGQCPACELGGMSRARALREAPSYMAALDSLPPGDVPSVRVYESDGSDGYSPGTWGVTVTLGDSCGGSGGHPSRERAEQRGRELARAAKEHWR